MNLRVTLLISLALLGGFAVLFAIVTRPIAAPPHEIYVNGTVLTMDSDNRIAEAVSVRDGVIDAVGGSEAMLATATDITKVVDLRGRTLIPGFVDAHIQLTSPSSETRFLLEAFDHDGGQIFLRWRWQIKDKEQSQRPHHCWKRQKEIQHFQKTYYETWTQSQGKYYQVASVSNYHDEKGAYCLKCIKHQRLHQLDPSPGNT